MSLELILGAMIGGVTEALVGKSVEAAPPVARKLRQTLSLVEQQSPGTLAQAVARAVDGARGDLLEEYRFSEEPVAEDVVALFNRYDAFAGEVARRLVFQGQPDFERLRTFYLEREAGATSERWEALAVPLEAFFTNVERRLEFDPDVGAMILGMRSSVTLAQISASNALVVAALDDLLALQARSTRAGESAADSLQTLVEQTAPLSEIAALLRAALARWRVDTATSPAEGSRGAESHTEINTGGGAYIGGNVNTGGGAFVGRDQIVTGRGAADRADDAR